MCTVLGYLNHSFDRSLRDFRLQTAHFVSDRDEQVGRASKALSSIGGARARRADVASMQRRVDELMHGLTKLRKDNERSLLPFLRLICLIDSAIERDRLRMLRETIATRRQTLSAARLVPMPRETQVPGSLTISIARARAVLVQELVEVFNVVEVGGRPPIGGKAGTKGEWTIGDLILPVPGDIRRACFFMLLDFSTDILSRIPSRPYQRSHHSYCPLCRSVDILLGYPAAL